MTRPLLPPWQHVRRPVIGMLHLPALPGSPQYGGDDQIIRRALLQDAERLIAGGVHGLLIENLGDRPYFPRRVPQSVVSHMSTLAAAVKSHWPQVPLGVNVLRNDGCAALAIAHHVGAQFIRVNVLCGARLTDQGIVQGIAHKLLRQRATLGAQAIAIFADVDVKHSAPLAPVCIEEETANTIHRGLADAVIISGPATGQAINQAELAAVRTAAGTTPVLIGSGANADSIGALAELADGIIVGTAVKQGGQTTSPIDGARVRAFMAATEALIE